mmetsp:Transcript_3981/g.5738  ORF Transcript_3981/g.5738 Transcript_3981/m.5738 type:complete len:225 (+) Transcript_3981:134-808(+)
MGTLLYIGIPPPHIVANCSSWPLGDLWLDVDCTLRSHVGASNRASSKLSTFFLAAGGFGLDNFFLTACSLHDNKNVSALLDALEDLGGDFFVVFGRLAHFDHCWQIKVILGLTALGQQAHLASVPIGSQELVFGTLHEGNVQVVGGGAEILQFFTREDVQCDDVGLGVAVLAGLGGGDLDALARAALDHQIRALADLTSLLGVGRRRTGISGLEGVILVRHGGR